MKCALITGGSRGIGRSIAQRLAKSGSRVWVWDLSPIEEDGIKSVPVDVTNSDQIASAIAHMVNEGFRIDILVNNAGYLGSYLPFDKIESGEWRKVVNINLVGTLEVTRQLLPHMKHSGWGRIVNMGSLAGKEGLCNMAVYSAASAGVIAFTKALGKELAETEIRVNCLAPGPIGTELI